MAFDSFELKIITGGYSHCDNNWNRASDELNHCFKIYHPVNGSATINIGGVDHIIEEGKIYFISGFSIKSQKCDSFMDVYWLHFVPASLLLRKLLLQSEPFHAWQEADFTFMEQFDVYVKKTFQNDPNYHSSKIALLPYSHEEAKLQSFMLNFIGDILMHIPSENLAISGEISKLEPAIKYMNSEFRRNPSLEKIASKSNLAPNYFHREFKRHFEQTPYRYMLRLRMENAIKLLTTTSKSVKEVAFECGYDNEFYFSRQFKNKYSYSPGKLKKMRPF